VGSLTAQSIPHGQKAYSGTIELGMSIADIAAMARSGSSAQLQGRAFLIMGTLAKPAVDEEAPVLTAVAALQQGIWESSSSIKLAMVQLRFQGDQFAEFLTSARGLRVVVIIDMPTLVEIPGIGQVVSFRVLSIQAVE